MTERGLRWTVWLGVAALAVAVYAVLGKPAWLLAGGPPAAVPPQPTAAASNDVTQTPLVQAMVQRLEAKLQGPDGQTNAQGWHMLAKSYAAMQRWADAAEALATAVTIDATQADWWVMRADVTAMARGGSLAGEPAQWLKRALQLSPNHAQALVLAGMAALEQQQTEQARTHWQRALQQLPADAPLAQTVQQRLAQLPR
jgi:cytochrome c-type biogenesis protein CcmH